MRLYTVEKDGKRFICGGYTGDEGLWTMDCYGMNYECMLDLIKNATEADMAHLEKKPACPAPLTIEDVIICAPIPHPVGDVMCLGVNYYEHLVESSKAGHVGIDQAQKATVYFSKRVNEAVGCYGYIPSHTDICDSLDYEVELGVIIGSDAKKVSGENALDYVFGYTIINDVSARNIQEKHKQWYFGKSLDGFCPMGPCIVTKAEFGDPSGHELRSFVNGQPRQKSNTKLMMKDVPGLIEELSAGTTLGAGTVIATGTPSGVGMGMDPKGYMQPGDVVECTIEGIGSLVNTVSRRVQERE